MPTDTAQFVRLAIAAQENGADDYANLCNAVREAFYSDDASAITSALQMTEGTPAGSVLEEVAFECAEGTPVRVARAKGEPPRDGYARLLLVPIIFPPFAEIPEEIGWETAESLTRSLNEHRLVGDNGRVLFLPSIYTINDVQMPLGDRHKLLHALLGKEYTAVPDGRVDPVLPFPSLRFLLAFGLESHDGQNPLLLFSQGDDFAARNKAWREQAETLFAEIIGCEPETITVFGPDPLHDGVRYGTRAWECSVVSWHAYALVESRPVTDVDSVTFTKVTAAGGAKHDLHIEFNDRHGMLLVGFHIEGRREMPGDDLGGLERLVREAGIKNVHSRERSAEQVFN